MLTFRQKILISNIGAVFLFLLVMFPLAKTTVKSIIVKALEDRATELIAKIENAKSVPDLVQRIKKEKSQLFFRVSILNEEGGVLYDTHVRRLLKSEFIPGYIAYHPEVEDALKYGVGYAEEYSELLKEKFAYVAKRFVFADKYFVIRTAFPHKHIKDITNNVEKGFLTLGFSILLLFSVMTWFIIHHFTQPIQQIIKGVKAYQEGKDELPAKVTLTGTSPKDDFSKLAHTLNSLSESVRKQISSLTSEKNEKEAILESLEEGVIGINEKFIITHINKTAINLLSINKELLLNKKFHLPDFPQFYELLIKCQKENEVCQSTETIGGHTKIYLDVIAAPKEKGQGAILVLQDKSSHYRILEMRKDFIANASHELKTPITIIQGFAETLHDHPTLPSETTAEITQRIVHNCERMTTIIKNLLTLADVENIPRSRIEEFDLITLTKRCRDHVLAVYPEATITIDSKGAKSLHISAAQELIEVCLNNLIENGAKYSQPPININITLEALVDGVEIRVTDSGIGIEEKDLKRIFERFFRVSKVKSQKLGSSGLGLSIVKTIIEKHFGRISVSSKIGEGTTFTIYLPKNKEPTFEEDA